MDKTISFFDIPRKDSVHFLKDCYLETELNFCQPYWNGDQIKKVNFGPIALFFEDCLIRNSGKEVKKLLMHKVHAWC